VELGEVGGVGVAFQI